MSKRHAVYFLAAVIAACGPDRTTSTSPTADGAATTPSPDAAATSGADGELHVEPALYWSYPFDWEELWGLIAPIDAHKVVDEPHGAA